MPCAKDKSPMKFETTSGQNIAKCFNDWLHRTWSQLQNDLAVTCDPMCTPIKSIRMAQNNLMPMINLPSQCSMTLKLRDHF